MARNGRGLRYRLLGDPALTQAEKRDQFRRFFDERMALDYGLAVAGALMTATLLVLVDAETARQSRLRLFLVFVLVGIATTAIRRAWRRQRMGRDDA